MNYQVLDNNKQDTIILFDTIVKNKFQLFLLDPTEIIVITGSLKDNNQDVAQQIANEIRNDYVEQPDDEFFELVKAKFESHGCKYSEHYIFFIENVKDKLNNISLNNWTVLTDEYGFEDGSILSLGIEFNHNQEMILRELIEQKCYGGIAVNMRSASKIFELMNSRYGTSIKITV